MYISVYIYILVSHEPSAGASAKTRQLAVVVRGKKPEDFGCPPLSRTTAAPVRGPSNRSTVVVADDPLDKAACGQALNLAVASYLAFQESVGKLTLHSLSQHVKVGHARVIRMRYPQDAPQAAAVKSIKPATVHLDKPQGVKRIQ